jgi:hypothetical protein
MWSESESSDDNGSCGIQQLTCEEMMVSEEAGRKEGIE